MIHLVAFSLADHRYALLLSAVERILRAVEITPLPQAPGIVLGVINVGGRIIPVVNIRQRFRLPDRELEPRDQLILGWAGRRTVALVVDGVSGVVEHPESDVMAAREILSGWEDVHGVARTEDGMIVIYDLNKFLSWEEEAALDEALAKARLE
jgi:purine-binding chemotaxis protein CheW